MLPWLERSAMGIAILFALIQLLPFGHNHTNPSVLAEPTWNSTRTRELAVRACYDCHSNETQWRWYSNVAPASWLIQNHVDEGRQKLNFSEWTRAWEEAGESAESVQEGEMPPLLYTLFRPEARLTTAEQAELVQGLAATLGTAKGGPDKD